MAERRAMRPVDVARLNGDVLLTVLRASAILLSVLVPSEAFGCVLVAHHRLPAEGVEHVLTSLFPHLLTGLVSHFVLLSVGVLFLVAVTSLACWRHVLACGGPAAVLIALAAVTCRVARRLAWHVDAGVLVGLARLEHVIRAVPECTLLEQLRVSLLATPAAPPSRLASLADRAVRADQSISRRAA